MSYLNISTHNSTSWTTEKLLPSVVLGLCFLVGVPGNFVVAWAISRNLRRASLTVKLMLNLAMTDILSLMMVPLWMAALLGGWLYGHTACKVLSYLVYCGLYASVLTITLVSVQRYILVLYPSCKTKLRPGGRAEGVLLASLWTVASILASPAAVLRELVGEQNETGRLACRPHYGSPQQEAVFLLLETLLGFLVPSMVLTICYLCIVRRVERLPFTSGRRLSRLVTWIVVAFFLFWTPWHILNLVQVAVALKGAEPGTDQREGVRKAQNMAGALTFLNSAFNPFLYAFASRSLRDSSSIIKKVERICHSKVPDGSDTDGRKASLCTPSANITLAGTTQLCPGQPVKKPFDLDQA